MVDVFVLQLLVKIVVICIGVGGVLGQLCFFGYLKVVIDFDGDVIGKLGQQDGVMLQVIVFECVQIVQFYVLFVVGILCWWLIFDIVVEGVEMVDICVYLVVKDGMLLIEIWLGQVYLMQFDCICLGYDFDKFVIEQEVVLVIF